MITRPIVAIASLYLGLGLGSSLAVAGEIKTRASVVATSDYVVRGLSQSSEHASLQVSLGAQLENGLYGGLWIGTVDTSRLAPDFGEDREVEVDYFIGYGQAFNDNWSWDINAGYYTYPLEDRVLNYDYAEFSASVGYKGLLRASVVYAPAAEDHMAPPQHVKLRGNRISYELGGEWPLSEGFSVNGGFGYSDLSETSEVKHTYWNAGLTYRFDRYAVSLTQFGTDDRARERFIDDRADTRTVISFVSLFGG